MRGRPGFRKMVLVQFKLASNRASTLTGVSNMRHGLLRLPIIPASCAAVIAASVLKLTAAFATEPSCGIANSAANCYIDGNGCEIEQGIGLTNNCNSGARGDGTTFWITHANFRPTSTHANNTNGSGNDSSKFTAGGTGSSAYATLYCTDGSTGASVCPYQTPCSTYANRAAFRGEITTGSTQACPPGAFPVSFAFRSICGSSSTCGSTTY